MNRKELRKMLYKAKDEEEGVECPPAQDDDPLREGILNVGRWWQLMGAFLLLLLFVVGVVLGIMLNPPPLVTELIDLLSKASSNGGEALRTNSTPQNKAYVWLNNTNPASYTDQEKIQWYALATLYHSTNGNSWTHHDYWVSNADVCGKWYQSYDGTINCTSAGEVSILDLSNNNLIGKISPKIRLLSDSLGEFNIQGRMILFNVSCSAIKNCQLGKHVTHVPITFATIGSHMCMHILLITGKLYLLDNDLTSTIPTKLGLLSNLEWLSLSLNQLTGTVPTSLVSLSNLSKSQSLLFQYKI